MFSCPAPSKPCSQSETVRSGLRQPENGEHPFVDCHDRKTRQTITITNTALLRHSDTEHEYEQPCNRLAVIGRGFEQVVDLRVRTLETLAGLWASSFS